MPWKGSDWRGSWTRQKGCTGTRGSQHGIQWVKVPQQHPSLTTHSQHQSWEGPNEKNSFKLNFEPKSYYLTYLLGLMHDIQNCCMMILYFHEVNIRRQHVHHTAHTSIWWIPFFLIVILSSIHLGKSNSLHKPLTLLWMIPETFLHFHPMTYSISAKAIFYMALIPEWHMVLMRFLLMSKITMLD